MEMTYLGARVSTDHMDLVKRAAAARGYSIAQYVREVVLAWAASDLKEPTPDLAIYASSDVVAEAAKAAGLSPREYERQAAREKALAARPATLPPIAAPGHSGMRPAVGGRRR